MRPLPLMGHELPEWAVWVCGYSAAPGDSICGADAAWHGFVLDDPLKHIVAMMESCDGHVHRMRLTADYVHPLKHPCGIPGSQFRWPDNECSIEWDAAAEFTAAQLTASAS